jgi:hypothetical protein
VQSRQYRNRDRRNITWFIVNSNEPGSRSHAESHAGLWATLLVVRLYVEHRARKRRNKSPPERASAVEKYDTVGTLTHLEPRRLICSTEHYEYCTVYTYRHIVIQYVESCAHSVLSRTNSHSFRIEHRSRASLATLHRVRTPTVSVLPPYTYTPYAMPRPANGPD